MPNEFSITIEGYQVKEVRCKNDECRKLLGYENVRIGVLIFTCPKCDTVSIFNMRYAESAREFMSELQSKFLKGGENK